MLLRLAVGGSFVGHKQKLFGWFGGNGLEATAESFEQLGLRPDCANAIAAGAAEAGGGALILAGLALPAAAAVLTATMITAIRTVHGKNGPWLTNGGNEYNSSIAAALALVETGPGKLSLEARLGREHSGAGWVLAAIAAGSLGAVGAQLASSRAPAVTPPSKDESTSPGLES